MHPTKIDTIRALYTYTIAAFIICAGGAALVMLPTLDDNTRVVIAGFIGSAITFLFSSETSTRTARQYAAASTNGSTRIDPGSGAQVEGLSA